MIEINGKMYASKAVFFKEEGIPRKEGETYQSWHRRNNLKYFPDIKKNYYKMCSKYHNERYHKDEEYRKRCLQQHFQRRTLKVLKNAFSPI
jgi:hypothetical protein